ncbi:hypothetical protein PACTADRAFT_185109 [Pachysolen tannophilus NRRL Y-2460]|uniref:Subtelomeric hrmA-associated cluster protein AFUB-079030/YDR124W-like helical bundle domain-containing protein n=1 Tax=Pachysolen tannophilus NRRL Y-2460 TaxID=669874 RepID=A0A1E4U303_PACTA|nr:hypothetical protein PACTADRAFT_185109 [Pachysolen tannophilus NRRL Y-2460]
MKHEFRNIQQLIKVIQQKPKKYEYFEVRAICSESESSSPEIDYAKLLPNEMDSLINGRFAESNLEPGLTLPLHDMPFSMLNFVHDSSNHTGDENDGNSSTTSSNISNRYHRVLESPFYVLDLSDEFAVESHLEICFKELQQISCKYLAKAWIKAIEPKKQSNYPYIKGDATRPPWWPADVRHREPDHIRKNERLNLMNSIVRNENVSVEDLEFATNECIAMIPKDRMCVLSEIYFVISMERELKTKIANGLSCTNEDFKILVSDFKKATSKVFYMSNNNKKTKISSLDSRKRRFNGLAERNDNQPTSSTNTPLVPPTLSSSSPFNLPLSDLRKDTESQKQQQTQNEEVNEELGNDDDNNNNQQTQSRYSLVSYSHDNENFSEIREHDDTNIYSSPKFNYTNDNTPLVFPSTIDNNESRYRNTNYSTPDYAALGKATAVNSSSSIRQKIAPSYDENTNFVNQKDYNHLLEYSLTPTVRSNKRKPLSSRDPNAQYLNYSHNHMQSLSKRLGALEVVPQRILSSPKLYKFNDEDKTDRTNSKPSVLAPLKMHINDPKSIRPGRVNISKRYSNEVLTENNTAYKLHRSGLSSSSSSSSSSSGSDDTVLFHSSPTNK